MATALTYAPAALGREEAAAYIGVSPRKLDDLQARSEIIPCDMDGVKRFRRDDLDEYVRTRPEWEGKR